MLWKPHTKGAKFQHTSLFLSKKKSSTNPFWRSQRQWMNELINESINQRIWTAKQTSSNAPRSKQSANSTFFPGGNRGSETLIHVLWQTLNFKALFIIGTSTFFCKGKNNGYWCFSQAMLLIDCLFLYFSKSPPEMLTKTRFMRKVNWFPLQLEKLNGCRKMERTQDCR